MKIKFNKTIYDKLSGQYEVSVIDYEGEQVIEIGDGDVTIYEISELDELIKVLQEAGEVLSRGRDTNKTICDTVE